MKFLRLVVVAFCLFIVYDCFDLEIILSALIACITTFLLLVICVNIVNAYWRKVLDEDCDPYKYLKMVQKRQRKNNDKNERIKNHLQLNEAVAYMLMGKIKKGKELLMSIDATYFSKRSDTPIIYTLDVILCHYDLGETEEAEKLYETKMVQLSAYTRQTKQAINILVGEREYYLGRYDQCYDYLRKLPKYELSRRQYLGVLYYLAKIEVMRNELDAAEKKFEKIILLGNRLGIVEDAKKCLGELRASKQLESI